MQVPDKLNELRRRLMQRLTKSIGSSNTGAGFDVADGATIKQVLVCRPNHRLGNLLLITPLLDELSTIFPDCQIDLFVKGKAARDIFCNHPNVNEILELPRKPFSNLLLYVWIWMKLRSRKYDLAINVDKKSASGRLSTKWANSKYKFFGEESSKISANARHLAKSPVYNLRGGLKNLGFAKKRKEIPELNLRLNSSELVEGKDLLKEIVGNSGPTICLFTHATGEKCYSGQWWKKFYKKLRAHYREYNFIEILPVENISKLDYKLPCFYSTNIREIGAVIANTEAFIGADSGIMHLASAVKTPTIGLFSVTDETKYKPYNEKSAAVNTNKLRIDDCFSVLNEALTAKKLESENGYREWRQSQFG